jgi:uncharacterized protein DUF6701
VNIVRLLAFFMLLPALAQAQIAFRQAANGFNDGMAVQQNAVGAVATGANNTGTLTVNPPARTTGDLLVLVIEVRDLQTLTINNWNLLTEATATGHRAAVYWRVATNTAADTASIVRGGNNGNRDVIMARMTAFSNVDTTNPFDGTDSIGSSTSNTVATGAITVTNACSLRVATLHIADDNTITGAPAGWFQSFFSSTTTGNDTAISMYFFPVAASGAQASVSFTYSANDRSSASQFALRPAGITINVPTGTQAGDVMVATIVTRPANTVATNANAGNICAPAGWTLLRDTINNNGGGTGGGGSRMQTYIRVADNADAAGGVSYTWFAELNNPSTAPATVFVSGAGGIASYSGVDNAAPNNSDGGNVTAAGLSHTGNSITTSVANTMLVSSFSYLSSDTWTAPGTMTERVDRAAPVAPPGNSVGVTLLMADEPRPTAGATGARTATAGGLGAADQGIVHMLALRPAPPSTPGRFNAFDTGTAAGAITGNIRTRVAGVAISFDVVAIDPALTGVLTTFAGAVLVELLDASNNTGAMNATTNCRATWTTVIGTVSPNPVFGGADNGRKTVTITVPNVYRDVRVRVTYPATGSPTATGCSTDNFAIRPASLSVALSDATWATAGTTRTLNNTVATGGTVHKAGQPFTIRVTPAPATATNYNGDVTVNALTTTLPAGGANGTLTVGTFASVGSGVRESTTASYNEAGAFNLTLIDDTFANVDSGDGTPANCTASGRYVCPAAATAVGRFVPDHFAFSVPGGTTPPQFRTFDMACAATRSFTYIGAPFGYVTRPTATVEARNAAGNITTNYRGTLFKLTTGDLTQNYTMAGQTITTALSTPALTAIGNGTATFTANTADRITIQRNNAAASAPFNGAIELRWIAEDNNEVALNGTISTSPGTGFVFDGGGGGIAFDSGSQFRYGRLRVANANGSQLTALPVLVEAQYYNGSTFITNAADNCTAIANNNVAFAFAGNLGACETAGSGGGTLVAGRRTLVLAAPGSGNDGAATLTVNLTNAGLGSTCTAVGGAGPASSGANLPWLQGNWSGGTYTLNPSGRATFGVFRGSDEVIFIRENF